VGRGRGRERSVGRGRGGERSVGRGRGGERSAGRGRGRERSVDQGRGRERSVDQGLSAVAVQKPLPYVKREVWLILYSMSRLFYVCFHRSLYRDVLVRRKPV
jgi:hypothetical protein